MTTKEQITECEQQLLSAMMHSDVKILHNLIHDQLVFVNFQGLVFTKEMDLEAYRSGALKVIRVSPVELDIIDHGSDCAVVNTVVEMKGAYLGQEFNDRVRFVRTWKKGDGSWKIIMGNSSVIQK